MGDELTGRPARLVLFFGHNVSGTYHEILPNPIKFSDKSFDSVRVRDSLGAGKILKLIESVMDSGLHLTPASPSALGTKGS